MADLSEILKEAFSKGVSDIHFRGGEPVWFRLHGSMKATDHGPFSSEKIKTMISSILPESKKDSFNQGNEVDFAWELENVARFRINLYLDLQGTAACFRILPSEIKSSSDLKIEPGILDLCMRPKGLVLVTGPTGSGKSTTLAAMIDYINMLRNDHIITIEDPIEFTHAEKGCLVNQREIGSHTNSFNRALRAALREDPDVVLVGEMRDLETTMSALEVAETGHLVFSTLHTNSAASTVYRIINQFPKKAQEQVRTALASTLLGVVSQILIPRANGKGRVAAREIMIVNHAISNLIRENKIFQIPSILQMNRKNGMVRMEDALAELVEAGDITSDTALEKSPDRNGLEKVLIAKGLF